MNLSDAIERYLTCRRAKFSPSTTRCDNTDLRRLLAYVGNVKLTGLTKDHLVEYFYGAKGRVNRVEPSTFNVERGRIKSFLDWCVQDGYLIASPMRGIDRRRVGARERVRLDVREMMELIEGCTYPRDRAVLALGCSTGLRAHAITALTCGDVDLEHGWLNTFSSKTNDEVKLPITSELDTELRAWLETYQALVGPLRDDYFLVPARHRGVDGRGGELIRLRPMKQMGYQSALRLVHQELQRIGKDHAGAGTHTLRRSVGRAIFDAGVADGDARAIHVARELLGHKNVAMTELYIGTTVERKALEGRMRGQAFLTKKPAEDSGSVVSLDAMRRRKRG